MKKYRWAFPPIILAIALVSALRPLAQEKNRGTAEPKLAIEIVDGRKRFSSPVLGPPSDGGSMEIAPTKSLVGWKQTVNAVPLTRIRIRSTMESGGVRIKVAGVFDDTEPVEAPGPKYGPVEKAIGSYLAREGETVSVAELRNFGFEPLVLKIVKAEPTVEKAALFSTPPQVVNNLKSVQVVSLAPAAPSNSYRLTVQNISTKSIVALDVYQSNESVRHGVTSQGDVVRPVMLPGATCEAWLGESLDDGGNGTEGPSQKLIIGTIVFDDETYEGDVEKAVEIIGEQKGRWLQLARAILLLNKILESSDRDPGRILDRLRTEASTLRIDVDKQTAASLAKRFPELPQSFDTERFTSFIMRGLTRGRTEALRHIQDIEDDLGRNPNSSDSIWHRLNSLKAQLEIQLKENGSSR